MHDWLLTHCHTTYLKIRIILLEKYFLFYFAKNELLGYDFAITIISLHSMKKKVSTLVHREINSLQSALKIRERGIGNYYLL